MVIRISKGKSIQVLLDYNEQKRFQGKAELIGHQGFFRGVEQLSTRQLGMRFKALVDRNRRARTTAVHISMNFAQGEYLGKERLEEISKAYLERIGFGRQPCLIYQHLDAAHPHVHLVTVNIDAAGKRIETYSHGGKQSEKARKELEKLYGLVSAENQTFTGPDIAGLVKLKYGDQPTKAGMNTVLNHVWQNYVFSSLGEFNAILRDFGMEANPGEPGSRLFKWGGLVYQILDQRGKRVGTPVKASSFHIKPTLKKLQERYQLDQVQREKLLPQVRAKVLQAVGACKSLEQLESRLKKKGIHLGLNYTSGGRLLGITYVDHGLRIGIKGSDLGKELGVPGLRESFELPEPWITDRVVEGQDSGKALQDPKKAEDVPVMPGSEFSLLPANLSESSYRSFLPQPKKKTEEKRPKHD